MLNFIRGKILTKTLRFLIVENQGLGYRVHFKEADFESFSVDSEVELYLYHYIKEDASDLYGFRSFDELEMFELLLSISGVGPKAGLAVLGLASVTQVREAIASEDSTLLTRVSGIGKKTAERIILELKNKVGTLEGAATQPGDSALLSSDADAAEALIALGYQRAQVRDALSQVDRSLEVQEKVREALRIMGK